MERVNERLYYSHEVIRARFNPEIFFIVYQVRSSTNKTLQVLTLLDLLQDRYQAFYAMHIHQEYEFYSENGMIN